MTYRNTMISKMKTRLRSGWVYLTWIHKLSLRTKLSSGEALENLRDFRYQPKPSFEQANAINPEIDLQIVVPVYNAEKYLDACIASVVNQKTEYAYKAVFINDGSTDGSADILKKYKNVDCISIIEQENGGVSRARNRGLLEITGRYVMFMDADDMLDPSAVQVLLDTAYAQDAQIVEGGYQVFDADGYGACVNHGSSVHLCEGSELFGYPWGKVIRSDCLQRFCFPVDVQFEDTVMSTLLQSACKETWAIPTVVYYYRNNETGFTRTHGNSRQSVDTFWIMKYCLEERAARGEKLNEQDLQKYLYALYRNWGRTQKMPKNIQESIFVLSCDLLDAYFGELYDAYTGKYRGLLKTVRCRSFDAFIQLVSNWWLALEW